MSDQVLLRQSNYLGYLPSVLGSVPARSSGPSLGELLCVFEKVLTGIEDEDPPVLMMHQDPGTGKEHEHESIRALIERIPALFDPWRTPAEFLPWLAGWLALEFPLLLRSSEGQLHEEYQWDEYQRRKIVSEIAQIYRQRGTKAGLQRYLELHVVGKTRPRIVIDDGSRLLVCRPEQHTLAPIHTLLTQTSFDKTASDGRYFRPLCVAATSTGDLYVGGSFLATSNEQITSESACVYIITSATGNVSLKPWNPPKNLSSSVVRIVALAIHDPDAQVPSIYALSSNMMLYRVETQQTYEVKLEALKLASYEPRDMVVSPSNELLILMQNTKKEEDVILLRQPVPLSSEITKVKLASSMSDTPLSTSLSLAVLKKNSGDRSLCVGVAGPRDTTKPAQVFEFKMDSSEEWKGTPLSFTPSTRSLVAPVSLVPFDSDTLYVLDAGLKPFTPDTGYPILSNIARSPAIYRLKRDPKEDTWQIHQVSQADVLVYPTDMAIHNQTLYVCDPGLGPELKDGHIGSAVTPHEFRVVVHFPRPSLNDALKDTQLISSEKQTLENIRSIVAAERPAHTTYTIVFQDLTTKSEDSHER